jgi:hypothetical protein
MPNLVDNYLELTVAQSEGDGRLQKLAEQINKGSLFNHLWPIQLYSESQKRELWENEQIVLRNLCLAGWGTKQDADVHEVTINNIFYKEHACWQPTVCVSFFTAWSAPIKFYRNIVPLGYQVYAEFYDGSDNTGGIVYTADNILYEAYCTDTTNPNDPIRRKIDTRFGITDLENAFRDEALGQ